MEEALGKNYFVYFHWRSRSRVVSCVYGRCRSIQGERYVSSRRNSRLQIIGFAPRRLGALAVGGANLSAGSRTVTCLVAALSHVWETYRAGVWRWASSPRPWCYRRGRRPPPGAWWGEPAFGETSHNSRETTQFSRWRWVCNGSL